MCLLDIPPPGVQTMIVVSLALMHCPVPLRVCRLSVGASSGRAAVHLTPALLYMP